MWAARIVRSAVLLVAVVAARTAFLWKVEGMRPVDAFYCVCATVTTLGYGDRSFTSEGGHTAPRSGLAWKHSIDVGADVIDADYHGPVGVVLFNHSDADLAVKPGDRIVQMIIERIATPEVAEVDDLDATVRGEGGFGSTGV